MTLHQLAQFRRRAVTDARRTGNISQTARDYRITHQTLHRWINRYDGTLESLKDRSLSLLTYLGQQWFDIESP